MNLFTEARRKMLFAAIALTSIFYSPDIWAKFLNGGIYVGNSNPVVGGTVELNGVVFTDKAESNITVTIGVHSVSAAGAINSSPVFSKVFSGQNFYAREKKHYKVPYVVPATIVTGEYAMVMKVGRTAHASDLLLTQGTVYPYVMNLKGSGEVNQPDPAPSPQPSPGPVAGEPASDVSNGLVNSGVWIPNKTVNAGSAIRIHNSIKATRALSNVKVVMQVRQILSSGAVSTTAVAEKVVTGVNFAANEAKTYINDYAIPSSAAGGQYILAIFAVSGDGSTYHLAVKKSVSVNVMTVVSGGVNPTPTPTPTPAPSPSPSPTPNPSPVPVGSYLRGINIMDMGIAGHVVPGVYGTNYTKPSFEAIRALKERGMQVLRIPFLWERIQPTLGGELDQAYLGLLKQVLRDANSVGIKIIIDMHNYGRYKKNGVVTVFGASNGPTPAQYADVWKKIVVALRADSAAYNSIYGIDIMNEPQGFPSAMGMTPQKLWEHYAQAAVTAIRQTGETKTIHVEGYSWASADRWPSLHPVAFINDPLKNIMYHAHQYMDNDSSGTFKASHAQEMANAKAQGHASVAARGIARVRNFTNWCAKNNVPCFLGEFGWPNSHVVSEADAREWNATGEEFMKFMDSVKLGGTMWATGTWLNANGNILNAYVLPKGNQSILPLSPAAVLEKYPGK